MKLNAQAQQKAMAEVINQRALTVARRAFAPRRKRRIADSWPKMARREKVSGEAHL